jgi:hypothetical protein
MNAKEMLFKDEKLKDWWSSIVGDSRFDRMMLLLKADTFEASPSPEQMNGITRFISAMENIVNAEAKPTSYAQPGLTHDLEPHRRIATPPEKPKEKTKKEK